MRTHHLLALSAIVVCSWADPVQAYSFQKLCGGVPSGIDTGSLPERVMDCTFTGPDASGPAAVDAAIVQWGWYSNLPISDIDQGQCGFMSNGNALNEVRIVPWSHLEENALGHTDYAFENVCVLPPAVSGDYGEADICIGPGLNYDLRPESQAYDRNMNSTGTGRSVIVHEIGHQLGLAHSRNTFSPMNVLSAGNIPGMRLGPSPMPDDIAGIAQIYGWKSVVDIAAIGQRLSGGEIVNNYDGGPPELVCRGDTLTVPVTTLNMGNATATFNHLLYLAGSNGAAVQSWALNNQTVGRGVAKTTTINNLMPSGAPEGTWTLFHSVSMAQTELTTITNRVKYGRPVVVKNCSNECQFTADFYGIVANSHFGAAPLEVRAWWQQNNCQASATTSLATQCQNAANLHTIIANQTFNGAPAEVQTWWQANNCNKSPTCQGMSDLFGIQANVTFAFASQKAKDHWTAKVCTTSPTLAMNPCQRAANRFAIMSNVTFGFAPSYVRDWWQVAANACSHSF